MLKVSKVTSAGTVITEDKNFEIINIEIEGGTAFNYNSYGQSVANSMRNRLWNYLVSIDKEPKFEIYVVSEELDDYNYKVLNSYIYLDSLIDSAVIEKMFEEYNATVYINKNLIVEKEEETRFKIYCDNWARRIQRYILTETDDNNIKTKISAVKNIESNKPLNFEITISGANLNLFTNKLSKIIKNKEIKTYTADEMRVMIQEAYYD